MSKYPRRKSLVSRAYYLVKPLIPRRFQILMRRFFLKRSLPRFSHIWPIDSSAGQAPDWWIGWPGGKRFALVLTHDVESERGVRHCKQLVQMEMELGFRSSFNFLLKKYSISDSLRSFLEDNGFEVGIHGCYHDGKKFQSRKIFLQRAEIINEHICSWKAVGFRAPSMHCDLNWIGDLDIEYDLSTFDTDPFEPMGVAVRTIYPFPVSRSGGRPDFIELPYTLPQDSTLFVIMGASDTGIWRDKLEWIAQNGGMALLNVHPDYMDFSGAGSAPDEYPASYYYDFLKHIGDEYHGDFWHALPRDVSNFIKTIKKRR